MFCPIARTTQKNESEVMTRTNISISDVRINDEAHQDEDKTQSESEGLVNRSVSRFPRVESVLIDIDAFLETHGRVA
jgi:hypothetical protein